MISWDDYYMTISVMAALRSKDPVTQVGACIVDQHNRIISTGYNGLSYGFEDMDMDWRCEKDVNSKRYYVVHAEHNAILASKTDLRGAKVYVTLFPCNECAKAIVQSGIKEIIYLEDKYAHTDTVIASKNILNKANVTYRRHLPSSDVFTQVREKVKSYETITNKERDLCST